MKKILNITGITEVDGYVMCKQLTELLKTIGLKVKEEDILIIDEWDSWVNSFESEEVPGLCAMFLEKIEENWIDEGGNVGDKSYLMENLHEINYPSILAQKCLVLLRPKKLHRFEIMALIQKCLDEALDSLYRR